MPEHLSLAEIGVTNDPGTAWHPRRGKLDKAWNRERNLRDLDDDEVTAHALRPEAAEQVDAGVEPMAAEDSAESPDGEV